MKLINLTNIPDKTIRDILGDLGIANADVELSIMVEPEWHAEGTCHLLESGAIAVVLLEDHDIPTLAHELKHAEQFISGLYEFVEAEIELTDYDDRWHEIEACAYESKYKAA